MINPFDNILSHLVAAIVYAALGVVLLVVGFFVFDRLTPGTLWKEILEEHNTALALLMGCVAIAMAIIVAAAIL
jgi:putative membrane protein